MEDDGGVRLLKGLVAGLVAGMAATWVKARFQTALSETLALMNSDSAPTNNQNISTDEPSTTKAAEVIARKVLKRELTDKEKSAAGPAVDSGFGILTGGAYGVGAEFLESLGAMEGLAFGAGLWAVADEIGVPASGLSEWGDKYPVSSHLNGLSGHLVYGVTLELVRKIVRAAL